MKFAVIFECKICKFKKDKRRHVYEPFKILKTV